MIPSFVCELFIWVLGTLYPAYASYKAVKTRDVKEYVHWMIYWIVSAFFRSFEPVVSIFLGFWFPFYNEMKVGFVVCMIPHVSRTSSIMFHKFVYPALSEHEEEIDTYIRQTKEVGYYTIVQCGRKLINYIKSTVAELALKHFYAVLPNGLLSLALTQNSIHVDDCRPRTISEPGTSQYDFQNHKSYSKSVSEFENYAAVSNMLSSDEDDSPMPKVIKKPAARKKSKTRKARH